MFKTTEGKWILFAVKSGEQVEHWPVDAKIMLANGTHVLEPPEGVQPVLPVGPPAHAGVPQTPVAKMFEAPEPAASGKKK